MPNFNPNQSAYRQHHSTETSLLATADNILNSFDQGNSTLLVSFDMSSAFDTIDHNILLDRLHTSFGVSHMALNWISSYLHDRRQFVPIGNSRSTSTACCTGVPQGSVLGPILFTLFVSPIALIANNHNVGQQQYADDT